MASVNRPVVFMGTPLFAAASLQALLDAEFPVHAVVTQPDRPKGRGQAVTKPPVKELAEKYQIEVLQPEKIRTPEFEQWLREQDPYYVVVVAYGRILPKNILELPPGGCINVHASLLPRWRGAAPIQWAVVSGDQETGVTTMLMDEGMDTGPMLEQYRLPIGPAEDAASLHDRLAELGGVAIVDTLRRLEHEFLEPTPQPADGVTYAPMLKKEEGALDWELPARRLHDRVRGLTPWPGAYTHINGQYLKVLRTRVAENGRTGSPGELLEIGRDHASVATGDGVLDVCEVQPAGKRRMTAGDSFRGLRLKAGDRLRTAAETE